MTESSSVPARTEDVSIRRFLDDAYWVYRFAASTRLGGKPILDEVQLLGERAAALVEAVALLSLSSDEPIVARPDGSDRTVAAALADLASRVVELESACIECALAYARNGDASHAVGLFDHVVGLDPSPWHDQRRELTRQIALHAPAEIREGALADWLGEWGSDRDAEQALAELTAATKGQKAKDERRALAARAAKWGDDKLAPKGDPVRAIQIKRVSPTIRAILSHLESRKYDDAHMILSSRPLVPWACTIWLMLPNRPKPSSPDMWQHLWDQVIRLRNLEFWISNAKAGKYGADYSVRDRLNNEEEEVRIREGLAG